MKMTAQVLSGTTQTITTKKGGTLQKSKLKLMDVGEESTPGNIYWADFLGEAALSDAEMKRLTRKVVEVEIRRVGATAGRNPGAAYLNVSGGAITLDGKLVQATLADGGSQS